MVPRPDKNYSGRDPPGVGLVFLCFEEVKGAVRAQVGGGKYIKAEYDALRYIDV